MDTDSNLYSNTDYVQGQLLALQALILALADCLPPARFLDRAGYHVEKLRNCLLLSPRDREDMRLRGLADVEQWLLDTLT